MDVSELRKQILRAIDEARREAADRRVASDEAGRAFEVFLNAVAVPLLRQAATVINATGPAFAVHTPAGSVRLASEQSPDTFLEIQLDAARPHPEVIGRVSVARGGRRSQIVEERPIVPGKPVERLTEEDLTAFLVAEVPKLIVRS